MKKLLLLVAAVAVFFSCQKDPAQNTQSLGESTLKLKINVDKILNRAVEGGHDGVNDAKVSPKIYSATIISYNDAGTRLASTDLNPTQVAAAVWGNYRNADGSLGANTSAPAEGAVVGLPKGTASVDVIINKSPNDDYSVAMNINYFNYRNNKDGNDANYQFGNDNFDRVILVTPYFNTAGIALAGNEVAGKDVPTYNVNFAVKPSMSRMEVYGAINVASEQVWVDGYKNKWRTMTVVAYEALDATNNVANEKGEYPKGAVKGTAANGFDQNTVYISEYYWYKTSTSVATPVERTGANAFDTEAEIEDPGTDNAGWVKQPYYEGAGEATQVKWLPNRYFAVDLESVFVNNIKVRGSGQNPYLHPWPGSQSAIGWPEWYKAYHINGWHTAGSSVGNTFLCMGNMWDEIATSDKLKTVLIPGVTESGEMSIIDGKAQPVTGKSKYYATDRNLGLDTDKAASYQMYSQKKADATLATDASKLRSEMPHIVLKVKVYKNATDYAVGTYVSGKEFVTISLFKDAAAGAGNYITSFQSGYIYRMNVNDLLYSFVGDVPVPGGKPTDGTDPKDPVDPDPEMPGSQLIMNVKVMEWTIQNIYPSI